MKRIFLTTVLALLSLLIIAPLWLLISGSFIGAPEVLANFAPVLNNQSDGFAVWPLLPRYPTLRPYVKLLLDTPSFFVMFWNSCKQVVPIVCGQVLIGAPAAWAFARFRFTGKKILFTLYIILMLMPFQVTMVSSYLVMDSLGLMDTALAVILPGVASAFPVFIMTRFFAAIPDSMIESAQMDGASAFWIFLRIGLPLGAPGILSAVTLGFLEYWNALEIPLTFLKTKSRWPLSLYLPAISVENVADSMVASVIMLIPALLIFLFGQEYLEQGISTAGMKDG